MLIRNSHACICVCMYMHVCIIVPIIELTCMYLLCVHVHVCVYSDDSGPPAASSRRSTLSSKYGYLLLAAMGVLYALLYAAL